MQYANGIAYTTVGAQDAPAIVLSNSLGTTHHMWAPQVEALAQRFRVVRYDTRGHGASTDSLDTITLDTLGRDVLAVLDALDIERAHFCGISMGGVTGQWLGVHAPERIGKLIVANTAAKIGSFEGWSQRSALVRAHGMAEVAGGAAGRWFTNPFVEQHPQIVAEHVDRLRMISAAGYAACCDALATADLREAIAAIPVPMLVIAGEHDPVTTVDDARFIAERVPGARIETLSASHLSNIEAADAFNARILTFLSG